MISRHLYFQLVFRVLQIVLLALAAGWLIAVNAPVLFVFLCLILEAVVTISLIRYLNSTNQKLSYFLESVQNEDSSLIFPNGISDKPTRDLYHGLDNVNKQIQELKIENHRQEQYFKTLLEQVGTGILTFNSKGFVLHANSSAKKLFGIGVLTHISQLERINKTLYQEVRDIKPFGQRLVSFATERETIQLSLKATPFRIKDQELMLMSVQNIRNELDEKELDSWMKLIRVLMHEIMNSIAPITSLSETLYNKYMPDGQPIRPEEVNQTTIQTTVRGLDVIRERGTGLMQFVESYRKLTRLSKPEKKMFRIADLFGKLEVLFAELENSDKVQVTYQINPPDMELLADENQIAQVAINLMKNALLAIENRTDGKIGLTAELNPDHSPMITISDNGSGIPAEILEQIFVPFYTTRENGSGIGLSISRQIMRLHGGNLQVHSVPGNKTVFSMIFNS